MYFHENDMKVWDASVVAFAPCYKVVIAPEYNILSEGRSGQDANMHASHSFTVFYDERYFL
jgi:hypothetical protein